MVRSALEVADIFRAFGPAWRLAQHGHLSLGQLKVMSAIEQCRTAALGGHVLRCEACEQIDISYNSCRNRHCPPGFDSDLQISPLFGGPLQRRRGFEGGDRKSAVVARL